MSEDRGVTLLLVLAALVPFYTHPMRIEPNEPARIGFIALTAVITVWVLFNGQHIMLRRAAWIVIGLAAVLLLNAALSLSPVVSFAGDFVRRFGALTQIALMAGAVIGALVIKHYGGAALARVLWLAGVTLSIVALLQQSRLYPTVSPTYYPLRSSSLIGYPTYLGGWIALTVLICIVYAPYRERWWRQSLWWVGVALTASTLIPSGARTATLALGAGVLTLVLCAAAARRHGWIVLVLLGILGTVGALMLPRVIGIEGIPLFQRLALDVQGNATQDLRVIMWERALAIGSTFPTIHTVEGQPDALASLRPLIGYGMDMQESVYHLFPAVDGYSFDRAHNGWLDTLLTGGWLLLIVRLVLVVIGSAWALHRLHLLRLMTVIPIAFTLIAAAAIARESVWLPVILTAAAIIGLWIGLVLYILLHRAALPLDLPALLLLAALITYLIDMQLGFETVAVTFTFWLAAGGAFAREKGSPSKFRVPGIVLAAAGALVLRSIVYNAPNAGAATSSEFWVLIGLVVSSAYLLWLDHGRLTVRALLIGGVFTAAVWLFGVWGASWMLPFSAVWDVLLLLLVCAVVLFRRKTTPAPSRGGIRLAVGAAAACVLVGGLVWVDTTGDAALQRSSIFFGQVPASEHSAFGAGLRFWDARVQSLYAAQVLTRANQSQDTEERASLLIQAESAARNAARLNPYDVTLDQLAALLPPE